MAARRKDNDKPIVKDDPSRIISTPLEDVMHQSMMPYAEHVILDRALPRAEDGLKPVQRRILYTMLELGNTPDKPHRKCARIVGDCLGKFHPHGDSSVYGALVHMAQDFSMRGPLVDGHGNFGSIDGDSAAAMRYTEARMTPLAMLMLKDIEKDTVPFSFNFDDTLKEPDILPARFPNLLVNGASGIAVGLATNIPPHNIGEAVRAVIAQMENPDITLDELMEIMPGPDFPTGGVLMKSGEIRRGYETGRGKLALRARVHIEDGTAGRKLLVITEVPFNVNKSFMLEKILKVSEEKKAALSGIYDIRDESDREGLRAVVELKRDADPQKVLATLYKYTDLQVTFGVNMVAIADGKPVLMNLKAMIDYFIRHQKSVVTRRTQYELKQAEARAHVLQGLMIALDNLDEVIALIRSSKTPREAKEKLMERFGLTEIQAQAILDMRLQRLTNLEIVSLRKEYEEQMKLIARLQGILASDKKLRKVIADEMTAVAETFATERRTSIEDLSEHEAEPVDEAPVPEVATVVYTRGGALKRIYPQNLKKNPLPTPAESSAESPLYQFETDTAETLYFFTDHGNCYPLPVGSLAECKPKDRGQLLSGVLQGLEDGEKAVQILCMKPDQLPAQPDFLFVTSSGVIKRSNASEYQVRSRKFAALNLKDGDSLVSVLQADANDVLLVTGQGAAIRFPLEQVPVQGRTAAGVKGIGLEDGDKVIMGCQLDGNDEMVFASERGFMKRIPAMDFESQSRGGKGSHAFTFRKNGANGHALVKALQLKPGQDRLLILQVTSPQTEISKEEIFLKRKTDMAQPVVMALMEDMVTDIIVL